MMTVMHILTDIDPESKPVSDDTERELRIIQEQHGFWRTMKFRREVTQCTTTTNGTHTQRSGSAI